MRRVLGSLLLVLALVATACGGSDGSAADDGSSTGDTVTTTDDEASGDAAAESGSDAASGADADQDAEQTGGDDGDPDDTGDGEEAEPPTGGQSDLAASVADEDDPLTALLGFDSFEDPSFLVEQQRRVDEQIQVCMRAEGFEYTPQNLDPDSFRFGRGIAPGLSDEEFAAEYGYGITESVQTVIDLTNQSLGDPNAERLSEMSEGEATAWQQAMLGAGVEVDPDTGQLVDPETGEPIDPFQAVMSGDGCASRANQDVFGQLQALFLLGSQFADLESRVQGDRRVVEITAEWSACMSAEGYDFAELGQPPAEIDARVSAIMTPLMASAAALPGSDPEPISLTAAQQTEVDEIRTDEIAVAVADHACGSPFQEELAEIRRDYELAFIDENADALSEALG